MDNSGFVIFYGIRNIFQGFSNTAV